MKRRSTPASALSKVSMESRSRCTTGTPRAWPLLTLRAAATTSSETSDPSALMRCPPTWPVAPSIRMRIFLCMCKVSYFVDEPVFFLGRSGAVLGALLHYLHDEIRHGLGPRQHRHMAAADIRLG